MMLDPYPRDRHASLPYRLAPVLVTAPSGLPVTLAEAKAHVRVEHDEDDTLIGAMLATAIGVLDGSDGLLGRCLLPQVWKARFVSFEGIRLPFEPVTAVASITYFDPDNVEQTLDPRLWYWIEASPVIVVQRGCFSSVPHAHRDDAVMITFTAGYANAAAVPAPLKAAILLMVGDLYRNRETTGAGAGFIRPLEMSVTVDRLIAPFRRMAG